MRFYEDDFSRNDLEPANDVLANSAHLRSALGTDPLALWYITDHNLDPDIFRELGVVRCMLLLFRSFDGRCFRLDDLRRIGVICVKLDLVEQQLHPQLLGTVIIFALFTF